MLCQFGWPCHKREDVELEEALFRNIPACLSVIHANSVQRVGRGILAGS